MKSNVASTPVADTRVSQPNIYIYIYMYDKNINSINLYDRNFLIYIWY